MNTEPNMTDPRYEGPAELDHAVGMMMDVRKFTYEYRDFVKSARWYAHAGEGNSFELNYIILGIAGEAGEATDAWKKAVRVHGTPQGWELTSDEQRMKIVNEAGDVLWYIQCLCVFLGIDIQELMLLNTVKLYERLNARTEHGLGKVPWPMTGMSYEDAKQLVARTEYQITHRPAGDAS
jgi:NTP pyrophosphatase (non-canonical NTP hydrolase)